MTNDYIKQLEDRVEYYQECRWKVGFPFKTGWFWHKYAPDTNILMCKISVMSLESLQDSIKIKDNNGNGYQHILEQYKKDIFDRKTTNKPFIPQLNGQETIWLHIDGGHTSLYYNHSDFVNGFYCGPLYPPKYD